MNLFIPILKLPSKSKHQAGPSHVEENDGINALQNDVHEADGTNADGLSGKNAGVSATSFQRGSGHVSVLKPCYLSHLSPRN